MRWSPEAEAAVKKVPFFVRKKVRARVEEETRAAGNRIVSLAHVKAAQARFLKKMSADIKGYQVDTCFAAAGCPNRLIPSDHLLDRVENLLTRADLLSFLKKRVRGELKYHHEFRITFAECPNACSQPQIKDIGIIGACRPQLTNTDCDLCESCVAACPDGCIVTNEAKDRPRLNHEGCMSCGKCIAACPSGTITEKERGYRVQLGGKLGRHPRLAMELPGIYSDEQVLEIIKYCIRLYKKRSTGGERFAEIFKPVDVPDLISALQQQ